MITSFNLYQYFTSHHPTCTLPIKAIRHDQVVQVESQTYQILPREIQDVVQVYGKHYRGQEVSLIATRDLLYYVPIAIMFEIENASICDFEKVIINRQV